MSDEKITTIDEEPEEPAENDATVRPEPADEADEDEDEG